MFAAEVIEVFDEFRISRYPEYILIDFFILSEIRQSCMI